MLCSVRIWIRLAVAGLLCLALLACRQQTQPISPMNPPQAAETRHSPLAGTASCSGRNCHGDLMPTAKKPDSLYPFSYSLWLCNDPHANAVKVLECKEGLDMGKKLCIDKPAEDARCLAC